MKSNIEFLLKMTNEYLEGSMDVINYTVDFPDEVRKRYPAMELEDPVIAKLIHHCLVEDGIHLYDKLPEEDFRKEMAEQYLHVKKVYEEAK